MKELEKKFKPSFQLRQLTSDKTLPPAIKTPKNPI